VVSGKGADWGGGLKTSRESSYNVLILYYLRGSHEKEREKLNKRDKLLSQNKGLGRTIKKRKRHEKEDWEEKEA